MSIKKNIVDNPLFYKWVFKPDHRIKNYWEEYIKENPCQSDELSDYKNFVRLFNAPSGKLNEFEKEQISEYILNKTIEIAEEQPPKNKMLTGWLKYAAIFVLIFTIGGLSRYIHLKMNDGLTVVENIKTDKIKLPTLIVNNDKRYLIKDNNANLDYSTKGRILINDTNGLLGIGQEYKTGNFNQLIVPFGSKSTLVLEDGTKIWLNAGSRIVYPPVFGTDKREVYLIGEAFFQVKENRECPFIVKTPEVAVKVLGTSFNVRAYEDENYFQAVLEKGKISLSENGSRSNGR